MAESPIRNTPLPAAPFTAAGVTISAAPPLARWSLRARDRAALEGVIGRSLPARIGETLDGAICLGPDEWLLRAPLGSTLADAAGAPVAVVDISERAVGIALSGSAALAVIEAGCPRDVSRFAVGYATRTIFEGTEVLIERTGAEAFSIEVWRSFAPWLWTALTQAASDFAPAAA